MESILLTFLRLVVPDLLDRRNERKSEFRREPLCKIWHKMRMVLRRNAGHPGWSGVWLPTLLDHFCNSIHEFVTEPPIVLVVSDNTAPACIAPARENPSGFRSQVMGQISTEIVLRERSLRGLLRTLQRQFSMLKVAGS